MLYDCVRRVPKPKKESDKDFYQTPTPAIECLLEHFNTIGIDLVTKNVLDPCCGEEQIGKTIEKHCKNFTAFDLAQGTNFLDYDNKTDIIIMNPPYSDKYRFINKAIFVADDIFCILPLQVQTYISFTDAYLNTSSFKGKAIVYPKMIMSQSAKYNQGGCSTYAWFHFTKGGNNSNKYEYYYDMRKYLKEE